MVLKTLVNAHYEFVRVAIYSGLFVERIQTLLHMNVTELKKHAGLRVGSFNVSQPQRGYLPGLS